MTDILNTNEERIGPYVVIGSLTSGSGTDCYRALDTQINRYVTIKKLPPVLANYPGVFERLEQIVAQLQQLNHDNIIYCIDIAREENDQPYHVSEFVDGPSLQDLINNQAGPPVINLLELLLQATDALSHAEKNGLIHGDLTPGSMTISPSGMLKVYDIGLIHAIRLYPGMDASFFPFDQNYSAPELAQGAADFRSDIYSLGVIFYQLLCGQHPGSNPQPLYNVDPEIPPRLSAIIDRMITREPNGRFVDYATLLGDLRAVHQHCVERQGSYDEPEEDYADQEYEEEPEPALRQTSDLFQPTPAMDDDDFEDYAAQAAPQTVAASVEMNYGGESAVQRPIPNVVDPHRQFNLRSWLLTFMALGFIIGGVVLIFNREGEQQSADGSGIIVRFFTQTIPNALGVGKSNAEIEVIARNETREKIRLLDSMLDEYQQDNGEYPFTLDELVEKDLVSRDDIYDGWGNEIDYQGSSRELSSAGTDGSLGTDDDFIFRNGRFIEQPEPLPDEIANDAM